MNLKRFSAHIIRSSLTLISPRLNTSVLYAIKKKQFMDWNEPRDFVQKLLKLKITQYNKDGLVRKCADKYAVRDYVREHGLGNILNDLIAVYDTPSEIDWEKLPERFVIKMNYGCGMNLICRSKDDLDRAEAVKILKKWSRRNPWIDYAELQYKNVPPKYLVEKYLEGKDGGSPEDYKIYCFHGKPVAVLFISGRGTEYLNGGFFDLEWNYLGNTKKTYQGFDPNELPNKPKSLKEMIEAARVLSDGFPFVRVDFYDIGGKAILGEMTFTPAGSFDVSEISVQGKQMGDLL